ncbi:hypothetical protein DIPPA_10397 [Diplonema papillatum]|nr:hypothetical protein DIPPA_10397 [Diplonema papillatum]
MPPSGTVMMHNLHGVGAGSAYDEEAKDIENALRPPVSSSEEASAVITDIVKEVLPACAPRVLVCGSFAQGTALAQSDLDLVLVFEDKDSPSREEQLQTLTTLEAGIRRIYARRSVARPSEDAPADGPWCLTVAEAVLSAFVPILRLSFKPSPLLPALPVDISVGNAQSGRRDAIVKELLEANPSVKSVLSIVKHWARRKHVIKAFEGFPNSVSWSLLFIVHCQLVGILPSHNQLSQWRSAPSQPSERDILTSFFGFVFQFGSDGTFASFRCSVLEGSLLPRGVDDECGDVTPLWVEDPADAEHNVSRSTQAHQWAMTTREAHRTLSVLQQRPGGVEPYLSEILRERDVNEPFQPLLVHMPEQLQFTLFPITVGFPAKLPAPTPVDEPADEGRAARAKKAHLARLAPLGGPRPQALGRHLAWTGECAEASGKAAKQQADSTAAPVECLGDALVATSPSSQSSTGLSSCDTGSSCSVGGALVPPPPPQQLQLNPNSITIGDCVEHSGSRIFTAGVCVEGIHFTTDPRYNGAVGVVQEDPSPQSGSVLVAWAPPADPAAAGMPDQPVSAPVKHLKLIPISKVFAQGRYVRSLDDEQPGIVRGHAGQNILVEYPSGETSQVRAKGLKVVPDPVATPSAADASPREADGASNASSVGPRSPSTLPVRRASIVSSSSSTKSVGTPSADAAVHPPPAAAPAVFAGPPPAAPCVPSLQWEIFFSPHGGVAFLDRSSMTRYDSPTPPTEYTAWLGGELYQHALWTGPDAAYITGMLLEASMTKPFYIYSLLLSPAELLAQVRTAQAVRYHEACLATPKEHLATAFPTRHVSLSDV